MASVMDRSPVHSPPSPSSKRPRGILKNSFQKSPPAPAAAPTSPSPERERSMSGKEITIANTQINAGHRRSSSGNRPTGSRRQSALPADSAESSQRLKWDEANLYLTEQERSSTMKITEPKTPYAKHYDPAEDPSDDDADYLGGGGSVRKDKRPRAEDDIPGLSLGEPEEEFPEAQAEAAAPTSRSGSSGGSSEKSVHVDDETAAHIAEDELANLSPEERAKHAKFENLRKKHYEMKNVAQLLGHPEALPEDEEDDDDDARPVPPVPQMPNGSA